MTFVTEGSPQLSLQRFYLYFCLKYPHDVRLSSIRKLTVSRVSKFYSRLLRKTSCSCSKVFKQTEKIFKTSRFYAGRLGWLLSFASALLDGGWDRPPQGHAARWNFAQMLISELFLLQLAAAASLPFANVKIVIHPTSNANKGHRKSPVA